ncbi:MAG: hypothetical protein LH475_07875 [Cryobacterium sp.]|uniref:hypothetical protein n=1 Tax=unclassified Cryobacterium TaxID=2649013 RepID=UPI0018C922EE|nr:MULTISPECIES: hypothetical protein [unclassified Cryobacterium]MCY7404527.1 hypothetical protein [Cryobacterium sp.]
MSRDEGAGRRRFLWITAVVLAAMLLIGLIFHYLRENIDSSVPGWGVLSGAASMLYADGEANLWAWISGLLLAGVGVVLCVIGLNARNEGETGLSYVVLGAVGLEMSADEIAQLHEKFARFTPGATFTFAWLTIGVPLAIVAGIVVLWIARSIDRRLRRRLIVAGIVYLLGAVGVEAISGIVVGGQQDDLARASLEYHVLLGIEEGFEATGALLAFAAVLYALSIERTAAGIVMRTGFGGASAARGHPRHID